jgi:hypothetical protein
MPLAIHALYHVVPVSQTASDAFEKIPTSLHDVQVTLHLKGE